MQWISTLPGHLVPAEAILPKISSASGFGCPAIRPGHTERLPSHVAA